MRYLIYAGVLFHLILYSLSIVLSAVLSRGAFGSYNFNALVIVASGLNISGDFYLLFLPILAVARLHIAGRYKSGLVAIFSSGLM